MADELKLKHSDIKARCKICFWEGTILDLDHYKDDKTESYWICPGCIGEPEPSGIVFVINNHRPREQELEERVAVVDRAFKLYLGENFWTDASIDCRYDACIAQATAELEAKSK